MNKLPKACQAIEEFFASQWDFGVNLQKFASDNPEEVFVYPLVSPSKKGIERAIKYEMKNCEVL